MTPITKRLSALAAQMREDARQAGIHATKARPAVEQAAADVEAARKLLAEAEKAHREALAVVARHELEGQEAADMAAKLDRLAAEHRTAPELPTPDEAVAAAGLAPVARVEVWAHHLPPDDPRHVHDTDAAGKCRNPECGHLADEMPFNVVQAPPERVAALTGGTQAIADPRVTMPDTGQNPAPLPPASDVAGPRHERPKPRIDVSGAFKAITGRLTHDADGVPDDVLAEGQRRARPDDKEGEK